MYIIGVDIGGTKIKCGLILGDEIISRVEENTNTFDLIRQVENIIKRILEENGLGLSSVKGVGVGFPGIVVNGVIYESANIGLRDFNLEEVLKKDLGVDVKVLNDGNLAALGEYKLGAGKDCNNMVMLTIGTGVGGGVVINGNLYEGNGGCELGHIRFIKDGLPCGCGRLGCMEQYVSYSALVNKAKVLMETMPNTIPFGENGVTAKGLVTAMKEGDACAKLILEEYVENLSEGILDYCNIFRPDKIVIGGGLSYVEEIITMVATKCKQKEYGYKNSPKVEILSAVLKNDAGIMGSKALF